MPRSKRSALVEERIRSERRTKRAPMAEQFDVVRRFLAAFPRLEPPEYSNEAHDAEAEVAAWRAAAQRLGWECPPELLELSRTPYLLYVGGWEFCPAPRGDYQDPILALFARTSCRAPLVRMLPVFGKDGDRLMLASDGAIRRWSGDVFALAYDHGLVASSFAELLEAMIAREPTPGLWDSYTHAAGHYWRWVDGIEYSYSVDHYEEERDGVMRCVTIVSIDLAPHYFRYPDGPGRPLDGHVSRARSPCNVEFENDPMFVPRRKPLGLLDLGDRCIDLDVEAERLIRAALERGWTGRDGRKLAFDGWRLFGLERPTQVVML